MINYNHISARGRGMDYTYDVDRCTADIKLSLIQTLIPVYSFEPNNHISTKSKTLNSTQP